MSTLSSPAVSSNPSIRELSVVEMEFVAGAGELNPQPLPPGPGDRFSYRSFATLFSAHSFNVASLFNRSFSFFH